MLVLIGVVRGVSMGKKSQNYCLVKKKPTLEILIESLK